MLLIKIAAITNRAFPRICEIRQKRIKEGRRSNALRIFFVLAKIDNNRASNRSTRNKRYLLICILHFFLFLVKRYLDGTRWNYFVSKIFSFDRSLVRPYFSFALIFFPFILSFIFSSFFILFFFFSFPLNFNSICLLFSEWKIYFYGARTPNERLCYELAWNSVDSDWFVSSLFRNYHLNFNIIEEIKAADFKRIGSRLIKLNWANFSDIPLEANESACIRSSNKINIRQLIFICSYLFLSIRSLFPVH